MLSTSAWKPFPRYMAEPESVEEDDAVTPQEHDVILRYAIVGIFVILATAALAITKVVSLPVTAGVVIGLVLGPLADGLVRRGVPQHLAAAIVVLLFLALILSALMLLAVPIAGWSDRFPEMMNALQSKLRGFVAFLDEVRRSLASLMGKTGAELSVSDGNPLMALAMSSSTAAGGLLIFVATMYFWLATHRLLKARMLKLCLGRNARKSAGAFFEEIETRVAHYFGVVTLINLAIGMLTTAIAWLAGLPFPVFWGALAFVLNYLVFIGPIIVAVLLFAGALLEAPSLVAAVWPAAAYYGLHLVEGNLVMPLFVGRRLTVSPFLVFISFIVWLWLWGPIGAMLSTPMLLIAMVAQEEFARYRRAQAQEQDTQPA